MSLGGSLFLGQSDLERAARAGSDFPPVGRTAPAHGGSRLPIVEWSLWSIHRYYVDPGRVEPSRLTLAALEALESSVAEVLVQPTRGGRWVRVEAGSAVEEFNLEVEGLWDVADRLALIFAFITEHVELTDEERTYAEYALVDGMVETLDPHTRLLRPETLEEMNQSTQGSFGGLGIEVGTRDDEITILRVLDGTPAQAVGLLAGDRIVQVNEESTVALTLNDAVALLKGPPDTEVTVYVRRGGHEDALRFVVTRAIIQLDSVTGDVVTGVDEQGAEVPLGLVQINRTFARSTGRELREKLGEFESAGVRGLILDMRQNPGGLLDAAVDVADAFLSEGDIVSTVGAADLPDVERATEGGDFPDLPIVVLIDEGSASATEIVAGALRNHDRAIIIGRRSFGKGSVQVLDDRKVGDRQLGLKLTRAQYLTPGRISIQSVGVTPDLETQPVWISERHTAYFGRKRFDLLREETLAKHLVSQNEAAQEITAGPLYFLQQGSEGAASRTPTPASQTPNNLDQGPTERERLLMRDPELRLARDLVMWAKTPDRQTLLGELPDFAQTLAAREDARISKALLSTGVDWSADPENDQAPDRLGVRVWSDKADNVIPAGEKATLTMEVTNLGTTPAYRVRAFSDSDNSYYDERELLFGRIEPGQSKQATLRISAASHELTRRDLLDFAMSASSPTELSADSQTQISVGVKSRIRPNFAFGYQLVDDPELGGGIRGDADGRLDPGEKVALRVWVTNRGRGEAPQTQARVRSRARSRLFLDRSLVRLSKLATGESKEASFLVELKEDPGQAFAELDVTVSDNKLGAFLTQHLRLPIDRGPGLEALNGQYANAAPLLLLGAPSPEAPVLGTLPAGRSVEVDGQVEGFLRVRLPGDQIAFVPANTLAAKASGEPAKSEDLQRSYAISPPRVRVEALPTETSGSTVTVEGSVSADDIARDLYITVYNPARDPFGSPQKVHYVANPDPKGNTLEFSTELQLQPGNNLIEVFARGRGDVIGWSRHWVLSTEGLEAARTAEADAKAH
jgi:carboxyl-terminal processing protease